jgi:hypothetical protein
MIVITDADHLGEHRTGADFYVTLCGNGACARDEHGISYQEVRAGVRRQRRQSSDLDVIANYDVAARSHITADPSSETDPGAKLCRPAPAAGSEPGDKSPAYAAYTPKLSHVIDRHRLPPRTSIQAKQAPGYRIIGPRLPCPRQLGQGLILAAPLIGKGATA